MKASKIVATARIDTAVKDTQSCEQRDTLIKITNVTCREIECATWSASQSIALESEAGTSIEPSLAIKMQKRHEADIALGRGYDTLSQHDLSDADFSSDTRLPDPVGIFMKRITPSGSIGVKAVFSFYITNRKVLPLEFDWLVQSACFIYP